MENEKLTILVVEDEELLLDAVRRKLTANDISAICHKSGKTAVDYLLQATDLPDAIWLDFSLKDMNGLEFMQEITKEEKLANIPVIVVSNSAGPDKVEKMIALGVKDYLLKANYRLDDVVGIIKDAIAGKHGRKGGSHV